MRSWYSSHTMLQLFQEVHVKTPPISRKMKSDLPGRAACTWCIPKINKKWSLHRDTKQRMQFKTYKTKCCLNVTDTEGVRRLRRFRMETHGPQKQKEKKPHERPFSSHWGNKDVSVWAMAGEGSRNLSVLSNSIVSSFILNHLGCGKHNRAIWLEKSQ